MVFLIQFVSDGSYSKQCYVQRLIGFYCCILGPYLIVQSCIILNRRNPEPVECDVHFLGS